MSSSSRELPTKYSLKKLKEYDSNNKEGIYLFGLWGKVYNARTFPHPGGTAALMKHCGSVINHVFEPGGRHQVADEQKLALYRMRLKRVNSVGELDDGAPEEAVERSSVAKL